MTFKVCRLQAGRAVNKGFSISVEGMYFSRGHVIPLAGDVGRAWIAVKRGALRAAAAAKTLFPRLLFRITISLRFFFKILIQQG